MCNSLCESLQTESAGLESLVTAANDAYSAFLNSPHFIILPKIHYPHLTADQLRTYIDRLITFVSLENPACMFDSGPTLPTPPRLRRTTRPRLVGIELNPGPNPKPASKVVTTTTSVSSKNAPAKRKQSRKQKKTNNRSSAVTFNDPRSRKQQIQTGGQTVSNPLRAYVNTLTDPFENAPVRLGFNCFVNSALRSSWLKSTYPVSAAHDAFFLYVDPFHAGLPDVTHDGHFTIGVSILSSQTLAASTGLAYAAAANQTTLAAQVQSGRTVSAGLRVSVRYAATSKRGSLHALMIPDDSTSLIFAKTHDYLTALYQTKECYSDCAGQIGGEVDFRPVDSTDLSFDSLWAGTAVSNTLQGQKLLIIGTGWLGVAPTIEYKTIVHGETIASIDMGDDDGNAQTSLAASGVSYEQAVRSIPPESAIRNSITEIEMINGAMTNVNRSIARTNGGFRMP